MRSDLPKIIAVDLDGTLFADAKQTILPQTFAVLSECIRLGCLLVPSTGRCELFVPFGLLPPVRYVIFCNGSMLIDRQTGSVLRTSPIKWQSVRKGWEAVRSLVREKHLIMQLFEEDGVVMEAHACEHPDAYSVPLPPFHRPYVQGNRIRRVASFDDYINERCTRVLKINFPGESFQEEPEISEQLKKTGLFSVVSDGGNIEAMARGCSKGEMLLWLCEHLHFSPADLVAFGDSNNDLSMLHIAGYGVAMGNASEAIRKTVSYHTMDNTENGIAAFLQSRFSCLRDIKM